MRTPLPTHESRPDGSRDGVRNGVGEGKPRTSCSLWRDLRSALPRHRGPTPSSECATAKQQSREHGDEGSEYDGCHAYLL